MAQGDMDPASPTTMVLNYLNSKGLKPTAQNVYATIQAARDNPNMLGDPGHRLMDTNVEDLKDPSARGGSVAGKVEPQGNQGNAGNVDTRSGDQRTAANPPATSGGDDTTSKNTSAQPTQSTPGSTTTPGLPGMPGDDDYSLGRSGLGGLILGGMPVGYAAYKAATGGGLAAGGGGAPTIDLSGAGGATPTGGSGTPISPMESAMQKATAPAADLIPGVMPQGIPNVTIDTSPQLSGASSPINPQITTPQPDFSFQPQPKLSGQPPPIDFVPQRPTVPLRVGPAVAGALRGASRFVR